MGDNREGGYFEPESRYMGSSIEGLEWYLFREQLRAVLEDVIDACCTESQRNVLLWRYCLGWSFSYIACLSACSRQAVKVIYDGGIEAIRRSPSAVRALSEFSEVSFGKTTIPPSPEFEPSQSLLEILRNEGMI